MAKEEQDQALPKRDFFGRRAGKGLKGRQALLMESLLPELAIDIDTPAPNHISDLFAVPVTAIWLESGFGGGEHLIHRALENPSIGYIGVEPFRNGMAKALAGIEDARVSNIRLHHEEAASLLDWLPENCLDGMYLLYPDPWPKKRHFKRRFISRRNLDRIARVLKSGTELRFASDIDSYVEWTLGHCDEHPAFEWSDLTINAALKPWANWPGTRYEEKAFREGRTPRYLSFKRL